MISGSLEFDQQGVNPYTEMLEVTPRQIFESSMYEDQESVTHLSDVSVKINGSIGNSSGSRILLDMSRTSYEVDADHESLQIPDDEMAEKIPKRQQVIDELKKQDKISTLEKQQVKMSKLNKIRVVQRSCQRNNMSAYEIRKSAPSKG